MTERLKEELQRLVDEAPELRLPSDAWAQGRRARHRDHLLTGLLLVSLVVLAGTLLQVTPAARLATEVLAPTPKAAVVGIPDHVYAVPDRLVQLRDSLSNEATWDPRVAESDLAVGPSIVAFTVGDHAALPVVVSADDGRYHPLDLPGFADAAGMNNDSRTAALALSPDGRRLAYGYWDPSAPLDQPMPSGIRIVDLDTGSVTQAALEGGNGIDVTGISWSPDGRWLGWSGYATTSWTATSKGGRGPLVGRLQVGSLDGGQVAVPGDATGVAVADTGTLLVFNGSRLRTWEGSGDPKSRWSLGYGQSQDQSPAVLVSAAGRVAVASPTGEVVVRTAGAGSTDVATVRPASPNPSIEPVAWLSGGTLVTLLETGGEASLGRSRPLAGTDVTVDRIATVDPGVNGLTIAANLVRPTRPTVSATEPTWPWSTERKFVVAALASVLLGLTLALVVRRRRRPGR